MNPELKERPREIAYYRNLEESRGTPLLALMVGLCAGFLIGALCSAIIF